MATELLSQLESTRRYNILDALYELGNSTNTNLDNKILKKLIELISHRDTDIRQLAVQVAGIHYQLEEAYEVILSKINDEKKRDQTVLSTMSAALGTLITRGKGDLKETSQTLARMVLNNELDPELRGTAYLSIQRINNKITVREYASSPRDIELMQCDFQWLNSLLS